MPWAAARDHRLHLDRGAARTKDSGGAPRKLPFEAIVTAAACHQRLGMPYRLLGELLGAHESTISLAARRITPILARTASPGAAGARITTLTRLREHAAARSITINGVTGQTDQTATTRTTRPRRLTNKPTQPRKHADDLEAELAAWWGTGPVSIKGTGVMLTDGGEQAERTTTVESVRPLPDSVALLVGTRLITSGRRWITSRGRRCPPTVGIARPCSRSGEGAGEARRERRRRRRRTNGKSR